MIIDREEVIIFTEPLTPKMSVKHPSIVKLFCEYYDEIWNNAIPIKLGTNILQEVVDKLFENDPSQNSKTGSAL